MSVRTRTQPRTGSARQHRRRRHRTRLIAAITGGILLAGAVIAAVRFGASTEDGNGAELPPVTAILVGPGAPAQAVFDTVLKAAVDDGHQLLVGPLTSADQASNDRMTKDGINDLERNADINAKRKRAKDRFDELVKNPPAGFAMNGIHALSQHLAGFPHRTVDVAIVGDMKRMTAEVDLNDPITRGDPDAAVSRVTGLGKKDCAAWHVHAVGGSNTDGKVAQRPLDLQVREFWRRLLAKCGGQLMAWDSSQLVSFPATTPVLPVDYGTPLPPCTLQFDVAADVLFADGSAVIRLAAHAVLERLVTVLTVDHPNTKVEIDGHTAFPGSPGMDLVQLSRNRTVGVANFMVAGGVAADRLTVRGYGPDRPVASNDTEEGRQANRRVEILVELPQGDCKNTGK